jgi:hypothetical protein
MSQICKNELPLSIKFYGIRVEYVANLQERITTID